MTTAGFPRVHLPGGPYGFPPMLAETPEFERTTAMDQVDAARDAMINDLRRQATALGLNLGDFIINLQLVETDFTTGRTLMRAEAVLRRPRTDP